MSIPLPLSGVRVLDLTWYTAGPFATRLLADYGADVVKIERPVVGDPARDIPPFYGNEPGVERSGLFLYLNTSKRSVTLDLKVPAGREVLKVLAAKADVVVENFNPRVLPALGLDYETLSALNPKLVMTSISNFGQTGPYRDWKGTDITFYGMGGAMINTGHPEREPLNLAGHVPSFHIGSVAAAATSIALVGAETSGEGDHIDVSAFEAWMGAIDRRMAFLMSHQYTGDVSSRAWPASALGSGVFGCLDGYFMITAGAAMFPRLAQMVGAGDLLAQPEWATVPERSKPERIDEFAATLIPWLLERTKAEIRDACQEYGVLGGPVNTFEDVLGDRHLNERGFFPEIDHPTTGMIKYPGYSFRLHTEEGLPPRYRAPLLGEHTMEVLRDELGISEPEIADVGGAEVSR
jgi:crotonobetainyl-CoA:carnitine CoA-transferase CaiB-like acyl-CoA transferase